MIFVCDHFHKCQCRFPRVKFKHKGEHKREREREERKDLTEGDEREKRERERERVIAGARFEVSHNDPGVGAQEHTRTDWSSKALAKTLVDKKKKIELNKTLELPPSSSSPPPPPPPPSLVYVKVRQSIYSISFLCLMNKR